MAVGFSQHHNNKVVLGPFPSITVISDKHVRRRHNSKSCVVKAVMAHKCGKTTVEIYQDPQTARRGGVRVHVCRKAADDVCPLTTGAQHPGLSRRKIPLAAPYFLKKAQTNTTVSFRAPAWLLPRLQSASVTCIISEVSNPAHPRWQCQNAVSSP